MRTIALLILVSALAACSTVAGVGQDIKSSAEWTKEKMGGK
jgi:predicted small secreted protein